ncbi:MAG: NADPH:quinone oxidoreductase family protein [Pseudomonadota bacterium]|nr:NADPH:quinone oxidoreductase family protein [Pseudomonadota bacterium]
MKALLSRSPGGPETLELADVPEPTPGPGQIRIAVKAVGVNYPDVLIIEDKYQFKPERPFAPGAEISGVVDAVGEGVTGFAVGQRAIAMSGWGGMVGKICVDADRCAAMPDTMPFDEASAFLMTYGTSHHALVHRAELRPGETLLVLGAAGGVGLAAVEIGKAMGARVVAAASSDEKLAVAKAHGADVLVNYGKAPTDKAESRALADKFKAACGENGADAIYDPVGGAYCEPALRAIAWKGRYLVVGFPSGIPAPPLNLTLLKGCDIRGVFWGAFTRKEPELYQAELDELFKWHAEGKLKPEISARFPLERAGEAISLLASRGATGKVVVEVD